MPKKIEKQSKRREAPEASEASTQQPKHKRGRPEKLTKIDDSPRNVTRALFGIPSDKLTRK